MKWVWVGHQPHQTIYKTVLNLKDLSEKSEKIRGCQTDMNLPKLICIEIISRKIYKKYCRVL